MGRSYTPKYVVEIRHTTPPGCRPFQVVSAEWQVGTRANRPGYGKPTNVNLERYVMEYVKSIGINGVNAHISKDLGYVPYPTSAFIRLNRSGALPIVTWRAALFQVFP